VFTIGYFQSKAYTPIWFVLDCLLLTENNKDIYYVHIFSKMHLKLPMFKLYYLIIYTVTPISA